MVSFKDFAERPDTMAAVTIELDMNLKMVERSVDESYASWLAKVGGLAFALFIVFYILEFLLTNKTFLNYMASELYYIPEAIDDILGAKQEPDGCCSSKPADSLTRQRYGVSRDFHNEIIPEGGAILNSSRVSSWCKIFRICTCCCTRRRIERIFKKARVYNAQELNITSIIKAQRDSQAAIKLLQDKMGYYEVEPILSAKVKKAIRLSDDESELAK